MRGEHRCSGEGGGGDGRVLRWAREGEEPGGDVLWWNASDIYRAAVSSSAAGGGGAEQALRFALDAMRSGRGEDADLLISRHLTRTIAWRSELEGGLHEPPAAHLSSAAVGS